MINKYKISIINKSQLRELGSVYAKCFNGADIGEHWSDKVAEDFLTYLWKIQPDLFFIASIEGKIVGGLVGIIKPWCDGNHIHEIELFVDPDHQNRGIATELTKQLLQEAISKYNIVEFEGIADGNLHDFPLSWYKRIGVIPTGLIHVAGKSKEILAKLSKK